MAETELRAARRLLHAAKKALKGETDESTRRYRRQKMLAGVRGNIDAVAEVLGYVSSADEPSSSLGAHVNEADLL
jgi:hypothetical protein